MLKMPVQIGAVDGIMIFSEMPNNLNKKAKIIAKAVEITRLIKRDFILVLFLLDDIFKWIGF